MLYIFSSFHRDFARRVYTPAVRKENPNLKIDIQSIEAKEQPSIQLVYVDDSEQKIVPTGLDIHEIISEIERTARWKGKDTPDPFAEMKAKAKR